MQERAEVEFETLAVLSMLSKPLKMSQRSTRPHFTPHLNVEWPCTVLPVYPSS